MDPRRPDDDTRTNETDFAALWSSDGVTRSMAPTATGVPADLPFLFSAGQRFGPYVIVRPIGKGGMGQVYEAEESDSGRRVAIKILSRGIGDDEERDRFLQEGRLAASLSHPNTVYVFGTTEVQGFPVIAMELAPSGTLKDLVVPGSPMPPARAADAILQVIAGLDAAASIGILHRDIKPSNCFVAADGRVLVGDFGLSIATHAATADRGTILGTPGFASPEQLRGDPLDVRSDIYSVGATIFYLLAGRPPFEDQSTTGLLAKVAADAAPALSDLRADVPRRLSLVIAKCLAKDPAARFADYPALRAALEPFGSASVTPAPLLRRIVAGAIDMWITGLPAGLMTPWLGLFPLSASHRLDALLVSAVTVAAMVLYYGLLEGHWGAAAGKGVMGLRVVDADQVLPGIRRATLRALAFALPSQLIVQVLTWLVVRRVPDVSVGALDSTTGAVWLLILFCTARPSNGYLGLHDRLTRTRVVKQRARIEARDRVVTIRRTDAAPFDGTVHLGPYRVPPDTVLPVTAVSSVVGFDERLKRRVRIALLPPGTAPLSHARRDLDRATRARWLGGRRIEAECWDAFEALDGNSLAAAAATPQRWSRVRHWLADLSREVAAGIADGTLPPLDPACVVIGYDDRARLADGDAGDGATPADLVAGQRFLYAVAAAALLGVPPGEAAGLPPRVPLPLPARKVLLSLRDGAFASADALVAAIGSALAVPAMLPRRRRTAQIAASAALPLFISVVTVGGIVALNRKRPDNDKQVALQAALDAIEEGEKAQRKGSNEAAQQKKTDAEIYLAEHLATQVNDPGTWRQSFPNFAVRGGEARAWRALSAHPTRTAAEVQRADATMATLMAGEKSGLARLGTWIGLWGTALIVAAGTSVVPMLLGLLGAIVTGSGFTYRPFGAALVNHRGEPISRVRAIWRVTVTWAPMAIALVSLKFVTKGSAFDARVLLIQTALVLAMIGAALWAIARPTRGLQDRLSGTWIVPR